MRLKDPAQSFSQDSSSLRFSLQNPYDVLMFSKNHLFCLEMKSTVGSLTFWREDFENQAIDDKKPQFNLKKNQIQGLLKASEYNDVVAGFVINYRKTNHTYFMTVQDFIEMSNKLDKKSFNEADVINSSAFLIPQKLKKVKYSFDVECFIDNMIKKYNSCQ